MPKLEKILNKYNGLITGPNDLTAGEKPSAIFYLLADKLSYLMSPDPDACLSAKGIERRRRLNPVIKTVGKLFLTNPQVFENRNSLRDPDSTVPDPGITLPEAPVIWASNHAFKDDTLATIIAAKRHAYILFGSIPQFYGTLDGATAWLNGVVMTNRKVAVSRHASVPKAVKAMQLGADLMLFPEGVWNKSPNRLLIDLWPGIYRIACETGAMVVPVAHYIRDCADPSKENLIHTVIDDPVRIDNLSEKAALELIRDTLATWFYLMMERYGKSTRAAELDGYPNSAQAWEHQLIERVKTADRYDLEIELCADYRPKWKPDAASVFQPIADITCPSKNNILFVKSAKKIVKEEKENDFQRRF